MVPRTERGRPSRNTRDMLGPRRGTAGHATMCITNGVMPGEVGDDGTGRSSAIAIEGGAGARRGGRMVESAGANGLRTSTETCMHHVGRIDWSFAETAPASTPTSSGLARSVLVGPAHGSAHTELAAGSLQPGGWLARHVHSYEEALYVLEGVLIFESDGRVH